MYIGTFFIKHQGTISHSHTVLGISWRYDTRIHDGTMEKEKSAYSIQLTQGCRTEQSSTGDYRTV